MDFTLLFIIVAQFAYIIYKDISFGKEREGHLLKIMSGSVDEYNTAVEKLPKEEKRKPEDILIPAEDATVKEIVDAKDKI